MEFRILGPLEVRNESGVVMLGGIKQRAVLAVLLLHRNESVHSERLALALWGDDAPASAMKTVQVYVSRLRKALGETEILATTPAGYCLHVGADELDADRFARLVDDGRRALAAGQAEHAAAVLREALALWRGAPLAELAYEPFAQAEIARLQEQRQAALEARVEADLAAGRHAALIGELRHLVTTNPTRERLAGQLMLALYRSGQQADALEVFQNARRVLVAEIGVEPGPELRRLQEAILRQDVSLEPQAAAPELPPELDASTTALVGRSDELAWLRLRWQRTCAGTGGIVTIAGVSGSGKSRLAAELAAAVHDGGAAVLYADGGGPADTLLSALRRTRQATHPTLVVIDAADRADVAALGELRALARELEDLPVLVLACGEDVEALEDLRSDGGLTLAALDADAVGSIARQYTRGTAAGEVPVPWLLEASGGVPRLVHELASQWARRETARHVGAAAGRAAAGREELRSLQAELAGGVEDLQEVRERSVQRHWEAPVVCPFKGLASFDVADAPYFFGREALIAELVARVVGAPLLGIVGPSGSGKSSVTRAGLLPALASGVLPGSDTWRQMLIRPGEHPLHELTDAMATVGDGERAVVAVDQFEETFTMCEDEAERAAFIAELSRAMGARNGRCVVVIALRADFYGRCAAYPELAGPLAANHVLVRSMQRDELRRAIELPARRVGLRVDPELADALVGDVKDEPGALPLLSSALLELWQRRDGRRLRHSVYEQTGGVRGAVARLAEDAFGQLDEQQQVLARGVLMRLAGEGAAGGVERRRVALAELETDSNEEVARVVALLTERRLLTVSSGAIELAHEALLREWPRLRSWIEADREGLRIHRTLNAAAREWEQLGRDEGALYRGARLTEAKEWNEAQHKRLNETEHAFLAASDARQHAEQAARRRRLRTAFAGLTVALALITVVALVAVYQGREAARSRDIAASRELAVRASSLLDVNPGISLTLALRALQLRHTEQAENALRQATLAHRATRVITVVTPHQGFAFGVAPSPDGRVAATAGGDRSVRIWSLRSGRRVGETHDFRAPVRAVSFSRDGQRIASAGEDGEIVVSTATYSARRRLTRLERDFATSIDYGADGRNLAIATYGGRVALVGLRDGAVRELSSRSTGPVWAVDFDRRARKLVSAGAAGARIWNVGDGSSTELRHRGGVVSASFSPDGTRVATAGFSGSVQIWDAKSGRRLQQIRVSDQRLASVRFSGDGARIVTGSYDGVIRLFALRGNAVLAELRGHQGPARADFVPGTGTLVSVGEEDGTLRTWTPLATKLPPRPGSTPLFSPDGTLVASGGDDGPIHLWNPQTGRGRELAGHEGPSFPQFSRDGTQIVSVSYDGTARLWDVRSGRSRIVRTLDGGKFAAAFDARGERVAIGGTTPLVIQDPDGRHRVRLRKQRAPVTALVFSPDARHLLSGSADGIARVWNARSGRLERTLRGHNGSVRGVSYSDRGDRIATAGGDATIRVWPADGTDPVLLVGHESAVNTARFNHRGDRLVSAGDDGTIRIWDPTGGDALLVLYQHKGIASGADFSADGRSVVSAGEDGLRITACEACGRLDAVLRVARTRAQHELSATERRRLLPGG